MTEIKTNLVELTEGEPYIPGPEEYVITPNNTTRDILRFLIEEDNADRDEIELILEGL